MSKKQTAVATSTAEAELTALLICVKGTVLPAADLWDVILQRPVDINIFEDNRSVLYIVSTGRNRTMRHFERTHRVSLAWLNEIYTSHRYIRWFYANSQEMLADLFTKHFSNAITFEFLRAAVGIAPSFDEMLAVSSKLNQIRTTSTVAFDPHEHSRPRIAMDYLSHQCVSEAVDNIDKFESSEKTEERFGSSEVPAETIAIFSHGVKASTECWLDQLN